MVLPTTKKTRVSRPTSNKIKLIIIIATIVLFIFTTLYVSFSNLGGEVKNSAEAEKMIKETSKQWFEKERPLITEFPIPSQRSDIIGMLQKMGWKTAIEVGVQKGLFAKKMLDNWPACTEYKLVDLWGKEDGYQEPGNHSKKDHDRYLNETKRRVGPYKDKVEFFEMRSTQAAKLMKDNHFDFVYLDARHDYCAVAEDIKHYWPKVRPGGILAGHDFIDAQYAIDRLGESENWGICEDGTKEPRAVRGAVEDFAKSEKIEFILQSQENFPSWFIQKPY